MAIKRQIILIPPWVQEVLQRNRHTLADCLDFKKIRAVMALNDLAAFVALQGSWGVVAGMQDYAPGSLVSHWFRQLPAGSEDNEYLSNTVLPLSADPSVTADLHARMFTPESKQEQYEKPFICYDLTPEFAGAVVSPGFFGSCHANSHLCLDFVEALLEVLYVYEPRNEVAKTPLFRRYLTLLSSIAH